MHCLEVIVARNERAAGREAGHEANDGHNLQALKILNACAPEGRVSSEFYAAYRAAQRGEK